MATSLDAPTPQPAPTAQGKDNQLKKKSFGLGGKALNYGFIGVDAFSRIKDGESVPIAVGKAVLTNAAFSLIPGGIVGAMGVMAVSMAPEMMNALDAASSGLNAKKQQFGGNFQESQAQLNMLQSGLGNMQNARLQATKSMANHARGAQKVY